MANVSIRMDDNLKKQAEDLFNDLGMTIWIRLLCDFILKSNDKSNLLSVSLCWKYIPLCPSLSAGRIDTKLTKLLNNSIYLKCAPFS